MKYGFAIVWSETKLTTIKQKNTMLQTTIHYLFKVTVALKHWSHICWEKRREISTTRNGQVRMRVKKSNDRHCLIAGSRIEVEAFDLDRHAGVDAGSGWNGIAVACIHEEGWLQIEPQPDVRLPPERFINQVDNFNFNDVISYSEIELQGRPCP